MSYNGTSYNGPSTYIYSIVSLFLLLNVQVNIDIIFVTRITKSNEYGIGPIPCPVVVKRSQDICDCNVM